jgi:Type III flagellar switch regulator (C-ring) FliN C-term
MPVWRRQPDMDEQTATKAPLSFLDHLRASAAAPAPAPETALSVQKCKQIKAALERALLECFGPGVSVELDGQELVAAAGWLSRLDAAAAVLMQRDEGGAGDMAALALERRTAILMTTAQFGGVSMLGLTDTGRALTDIEQSLLTALGAAVLPSVHSAAQSDAVPVKLFDPQTASALFRGEAMLTVFDFSVLLGGVRMSLLLALPAGTAQSDHVGGKENIAWKSAIGSELTRSRMRLEAVVDILALPLSNLHALRPGDIIPIPEGGLGRTLLVSRGETLLTGRLGKLAGAYTVRVTSPVAAEASPLHSLMRSAGVKANSKSETR